VILIEKAIIIDLTPIIVDAKMDRARKIQRRLGNHV
jgi:hypothetical protein